MVVYDLGKITDWLSSIGTISAVVVALYLSKKDTRPKAKVNSKFSYEVNGSHISRSPIYISLEIVNQGLIPIHLTECSIQHGKWDKRKLVFLNGSNNVNKLIKPGELYGHCFDYSQIRNYLLENKKNKLTTYIYFKDANDKKYKTKIKLRL